MAASSLTRQAEIVMRERSKGAAGAGVMRRLGANEQVNKRISSPVRKASRRLIMRPIAKPFLAVWLSVGLSALFIVLNPILAQEKMPLAKPSHVPLRTGEKKEEILARLGPSIPQLIKEGDVSGLLVAMLRDGKLVWHRVLGVKNSKTNDPVSDTTLFEAASLSKPVFAYGVLKLVEAGKIDLDTAMDSYLPDNYDVGDDARLGQITARRVLSHNMGFPNWRPRGRAAQRNGHKGFGRRRPLATDAAIIDRKRAAFGAGRSGGYAGGVVSLLHSCAKGDASRSDNGAQIRIVFSFQGSSLLKTENWKLKTVCRKGACEEVNR